MELSVVANKISVMMEMVSALLKIHEINKVKTSVPQSYYPPPILVTKLGGTVIYSIFFVLLNTFWLEFCLARRQSLAPHRRLVCF